MTKDSALRMALEALELNEKCSQSMDIQICADASQKTFHAITAIKEALAQPEHGNPAVVRDDGNICYQYTTPPQRKWVGLTDDEIIDVIHPLVMADMADEATDYEIARAIEAKLKEKNNG